MRSDEVVGWFGQLHPRFDDALDLAQAAWVFEIRLDALARGLVTAYQDISKYPSVRRDIALLVDQTVSNQALVNCVKKHAPDTLQSVLTFDVFSGKNIEQGKKSVALGLILQDFSRTLDESEVDRAVEAVLSGLADNLGVRLRA